MHRHAGDVRGGDSGYERMCSLTIECVLLCRRAGDVRGGDSRLADTVPGRASDHVFACP